MNNNTDKITVSISYSRSDIEIAKEIAAGLEYDGAFEVLLDIASLEAGEKWKKRL